MDTQDMDYIVISDSDDEGQGSLIISDESPSEKNGETPSNNFISDSDDDGRGTLIISDESPSEKNGETPSRFEEKFKGEEEEAYIDNDDNNIDLKSSNIKDPLEEEDGEFSCFKCNYKAKTELDLEKHRVFEHYYKSYRCPKCDLFFSRGVDITAHMIETHQSHITDIEVKQYATFQDFSCPKCVYVGTSIMKLHQHDMCAHVKNNQKTCQLCGFVANSEASLDYHFEKKHTRRKCRKDIEENLSKEEEADKEDADNNVDKSSKDPLEVTTLSCSKCKYKAKTAFDFEKHRVLEHYCKSYTCPHCKTYFYKGGGIIAHMLETHQTQISDTDVEQYATFRNFPCPKCSYVASSVGKLNRHDRSFHCRKRTCGQCDFVCKSDILLHSHVQKAHSKKSSQKYKCQQCPHWTKDFMELQKHVVSEHKTTKPFTCSHCNYGSDSYLKLKHHYKICSKTKFLI